ncbi:hypothetical protein HPB51_029517 [Rhipicephalus microplus]|uniref:Uncharacterized protein n=1 Tax=Rhipicephalus microplus TaxID=6941 RepID=A0A9J6CTW0_RHIMP|nr:hypothetical protein HPB51_029517 [Rhipicephalus microplus]
MQPIWAWFQHPSTRRHQLELILALILSITMMPVLYMAWAYAVLDVAPNVNWTVAMVFAPYLLFQTTTWIGFAAYSFCPLPGSPPPLVRTSSLALFMPPLAFYCASTAQKERQLMEARAQAKKNPTSQEAETHGFLKLSFEQACVS